MSGKIPSAIEIGGAFADWPLADLREVVVQADQAGVDLLVLPDVIAPQGGGDGWPDGLMLIGWLAPLTKRIRFAARLSSLGHQPYNLARRLASLDLISKGRAGWLVSNASNADHRAAFSGAKRLEGVDLDEREREFKAVVEGLWQSWDADALVLDRVEARFFKPEAMHPLNHQGPHFSVRGPLNVMRSPRGQPDLMAESNEGEMVVVESAAAGRALLENAA